MRYLLPPAALLALAACMDEPPGGSPPPPVPGVQCNADPARQFAGRRYQPALGTRIQRRSGARTTRVIRPGEIVTMEFRPDRVNVTLDDKGVVTEVRCG